MLHFSQISEIVLSVCFKLQTPTQHPTVFRVDVASDLSGTVGFQQNNYHSFFSNHRDLFGKSRFPLFGEVVSVLVTTLYDD